MWRAVGAIAVVHAAADHTKFHRQSDMQLSRLIGWRYGSYSVIPRLLVNMTLDKTSLGLCCMDKFVLNAVTHDDGSMQSAELPTPRIDTVNSMSSVHELALDRDSGLEAFSGSSRLFGHPQDGLYLNMERYPRNVLPDIALCGRVSGDSVGFVSITEAIRTLGLSLKAREECPGHGSRESREVYVIKTRRWCQPGPKLVAKGLLSLIPVNGSHLWALFLAGQSCHRLEGRIALGCFQCASRGLHENSYVIGYQDEGEHND